MSITIELKLGAVQEWLRNIAGCPEPEHAALWIGYDTDGCGCAVNGVIVVRWTNDRRLLNRADTWAEASIKITGAFPDGDQSDTSEKRKLFTPVVLYEPRSEWAYDPVMRLDYNSASRRFELRSDNQIFCI